MPATLMTVPVKTVGGDCEEKEPEQREEQKQDPLTLSNSFANYSCDSTAMMSARISIAKNGQSIDMFEVDETTS